ncbi:uncharacterized protein E0L32_010751 [Thyridium curvatum]|uniref:Asl1-like glycosyl hydrolase catalytic domain-containing protein n=1 Tax=Thyridium curvatum TaxID=1093900 RepID=A0A507AR09_9PEZI|nr:uncharacterized protein E0L32_010751 [Thyridium curvatum]TPX07329.1 hypothetical protein E0L32_010751 [Thyridium curvatum]
MVIRKRCLLWDYTNTRDRPGAIDQLNFNGPFRSVANWNTWAPPELKGRLPYYPQARTPAQLQDGSEDYRNFQAVIGAAGSKPIKVLFLNEPERIPCSPQQAAQLWRQKMLPLRRGHGNVKLVGPSCASDDAGHKWLREFMGAIGGDKPDFLGCHWYGTDAGACKKYLEGLHNEFKLPLFVSEIASISRDGNQVNAFTADMADWMDHQGFVEEYAFFGCMAHVADNFVSPAAQLMAPDGKFTPLMKRLMNDQPMKK